MANAQDSAATDIDTRAFDAGALVRTASWGIGAAATLFLAVLAGLSESAAPRVAIALSTLTGQAPTTATVPVAAPTPQPPPQLVTETRRLHDQVRLLVADRDRLAQRLGTLERNLEDVTGSIRRHEASAKVAAAAPLPDPAAPPASIVVAATPWPVIPPEAPVADIWNDPPPVEAEPEVTASLPPATPLPPPRPALPADTTEPTVEAPAARPAQQRQAVQTPDPAPARTGYGVDLGGAVSVDRLRMLWQSLRHNEPRLLQGLRPITHVREIKRGGRPDVRLIAGPLRSADDAARLCAAILNAGRYCEPAVFHGQRLSLR